MPSPTTGAIGLVPQAFELLQKLICARFGLVYTIETAYLIERRLQQRLEAHGLTSFLDYYHLLTDPAQPESRRERELQEIFELLSTRLWRHSTRRTRRSSRSPTATRVSRS